jgi:hypothetical protein
MFSIAGFVKRFVKRSVKNCAVEIDTFYSRLSYRFLEKYGAAVVLLGLICYDIEREATIETLSFLLQDCIPSYAF